MLLRTVASTGPVLMKLPRTSFSSHYEILFESTLQMEADSWYNENNWLLHESLLFFLPEYQSLRKGLYRAKRLDLQRAENLKVALQWDFYLAKIEEVSFFY